MWNVVAKCTSRARDDDARITGNQGSIGDNPLREWLMSKALAAGQCAFFITASSLACAQTPFADPRAPAADARAVATERAKRLLSADWKASTDLRIGIVKAALRLNLTRRNTGRLLSTLYATGRR